MDVTVFLPGLRIAAGMGFDPCEGLALDGLSQLLGRASTSEGDAIESAAWLSAAFGATGAGIAKLTYLLDFGEMPEGEWLRADPVHLRPDRDRVMLFDASVLDLQADEAASLVALLNRQFAEDGLKFVMATPDRWYVQLPDTVSISTTPLDRVVGGDIHPHLPAGAEAMKWHRWLNEIQMLLYTAPANDARELAGKRAANSVWVWGEGALPASASTVFTHVVADAPAARAYAALGKLANSTLGAGIAGMGEGGSVLVYLDSLSSANSVADVYGWRDALQTAETQWFAPLWALWREGRIDRLEIIMPGPKNTRRAVLTKSDRWKFWRAALPSKQLAV